NFRFLRNLPSCTPQYRAVVQWDPMRSCRWPGHDANGPKAAVSRAEFPQCSDLLTDPRQSVMLSRTPDSGPADAIRWIRTTRVHHGLRSSGVAARSAGAAVGADAADRRADGIFRGQCAISLVDRHICSGACTIGLGRWPQLTD